MRRRRKERPCGKGGGWGVGGVGGGEVKTVM